VQLAYNTSVIDDVGQRRIILADNEMFSSELITKMEITLDNANCDTNVICMLFFAGRIL